MARMADQMNRGDDRQLLLDIPKQVHVRLTIRPASLLEANQFVSIHHRHLGPLIAHKFSLKVIDQDRNTRGVAIVGRPVARALDDGYSLEVCRLATDGCKNACSSLYAAVRRAAIAMGYCRLFTYILETESGTSLRAAGWWMEATDRGGRIWNDRNDGRRRTERLLGVRKSRWRGL